MIQRGEAFEKLCTASMVNKYRSYDGPALIEGEVEMVTESGSDVSWFRHTIDIWVACPLTFDYLS
jgi:hypothetical protein